MTIPTRLAETQATCRPFESDDVRRVDGFHGYVSRRVREVVDEVAHHEVRLHRPVVLVEDPVRLLRALLVPEALEDEVLVDLVDIDVEVVDGVAF